MKKKKKQWRVVTTDDQTTKPNVKIVAVKIPIIKKILSNFEKYLNNFKPLMRACQTGGPRVACGPHRFWY